MGIINIIVIGLGLAMDALAVSITSGLTVRRVRIRYALKLALSFAGFQALMPVIGWLAGIRFSEKIRTVDHWVAMLLLAAIGIKMILDTVKENAKSGGAQAVPSYGGEVGMRTLVVLAIATSIDALAVGVSFSCADVNRVSILLLDAGAIGAITFLLCFPGVYIGAGLVRHSVARRRDRRHPAHWDGSENFCGAMYRRLKLYPSGISAIKPQYGQLSNDVPLCRKQAD